ncbi:MAG: cation diffusion facilitator family transporter [archaeon]|nr:cation diffusion facilitator family transporter [archaeon]
MSINDGTTMAESAKTLEQTFTNERFREKLLEENKSAIGKLIRICCFCFTFMTIEFVGGFISGSLAIMTDAAHLLSDFAGFLISMFALFIATRPANKSLTYGYHRAEVLGALVSILIIWILTVWLLSEAVYRIFYPHEIIGLVMMGIAACGLLFNFIMSRVLAYNPAPNFAEGQTMKEIKQQEMAEEEGLETPLLDGQEKNDDDNRKIII